jgi:hypothetical protein
MYASSLARLGGTIPNVASTRPSRWNSRCRLLSCGSRGGAYANRLAFVMSGSWSNGDSDRGVWWASDRGERAVEPPWTLARGLGLLGGRGDEQAVVEPTPWGRTSSS